MNDLINISTLINNFNDDLMHNGYSKINSHHTEHKYIDFKEVVIKIERSDENHILKLNNASLHQDNVETNLGLASLFLSKDKDGVFLYLILKPYTILD